MFQDISLILPCVFLVVFVVIAIRQFFFKKESFLFKFEITPDSLKVHRFPFLVLTFSFNGFETVQLLTYSEGLVYFFRFGSFWIEEKSILIKKSGGFIREFVIVPEKPEEFF